MITYQSIACLLLAYIVGSIPTAVWIGKAFYGIDVREYGSGNAGASNTFRILGKKAGVPVMLIDILKGFCATNIVYLLRNYTPGTEAFINYQLALGVTAVMGHVFPVFAGFRGGKGIATLLGLLLAVHPEAAIICLILFVVILLITKYVSLSSMLTGFAFPMLIIFYFHEPIKSMILFGMSIAVLILITHQKNIERLLKGKESKANLFKRKV